MEQDTFTSLSRMGRALWADAEIADRSCQETVGAVALLQLTEARFAEKASQALLERVLREGPGRNATALNHPFYRLSAQERLILCALHACGWSYERIARALPGEQLSAEEVESASWRARLQLLPAHHPIPVGPKRRGANCPEYDPQSPWTQRFMDEAYGPRERVFFQNHLMACESCREALNRCRDLYFVVDALIPRDGAEPSSPGRDRLEKIWNVTQRRLLREPLTLRESLEVFFRKRDVQIAVAMLVLLMIGGLVF